RSTAARDSRRRSWSISALGRPTSSGDRSASIATSWRPISCTSRSCAGRTPSGYEEYDLWGVAPEGQSDHSWSDISAFKRKVGGRELALVPTLDYVYDPLAYERYTTWDS